MKHSIKCGLTAGLAIVGTSVVALTPISPSTTASPRTVDADTTLTTTWTTYSDQQVATALFVRAVGEAMSAPFIPVAAAQNLINQDQDGLYQTIKNAVDAPSWVAAPAYELAGRLVPAELGGGTNGYDNNAGPTGAGGDGAILQFRTFMIDEVRNPLTTSIAGALDVAPGDRGYNDAADLAKKYLRTDLVAAVIADPETGLAAVNSAARAALNKQSLKTQKSVAAAQVRIKKVTDKLSAGDFSGAATQVGANVQNRVNRLQKDIKNATTAPHND